MRCARSALRQESRGSDNLQTLGIRFRVNRTGWPKDQPNSLLWRGEVIALFSRVASLELMPNRKNKNDVFGRQPTVLRDVSVTAAR